ncbi:hypothetical protein B0A48_06772 [Cryoendolithus antarcticus]|uniref:Putative transcription factor kapC n=1 Tax=Cryoendolithus antarcticus TaxID=1507870 RepID=A0A1V8T9F0_9PEZI|nr:hypothetical protein B0A48_06772 [Cryoendolithus antarcticus]
MSTEGPQGQNLEMTLREHLLAQQSAAGSSSAGQSNYPPPPSTSAPLPGHPYQHSDSASPQDHLDASGLPPGQQATYGMANDSAGDESMGGADGMDAKGKRELSTSKRAAQNRAAQRAFRQRKEGYIKKLEEQVKDFQSVEQSYRALQHENYQLREYILNLQSRLLENQSDFPPAPSHVDLNQTPRAPSPTERPSSTEQQLRRELQQNVAPVAPIASGPDPPRQAPIDHLGAAAARAVELEAKRPLDTPYALSSDYPSKRAHAEASADAPMSDAKPQR